MKETAYCIKEPNSNVLRINSIRYLRKDSIQSFIGEGEWKDWVKYGWKCVKVEINQIK